MSWYFPGESSGTRKWRRRFGLPFLGFLVLAVIDIWLLVVIGDWIGALPVWLFLIAEALVGGWVIRQRWRGTLRRLAEVREGKVDLQQPGESIAKIVDTGLVVAGGAALIFPGVITALLGIVCLLPFTRRFPAAFLQRSIERQLPDVFGPGMRTRVRHDPGSGVVVEGEVVDDPAPDDRSNPEEPVVIRGEVTDR